MNSDFLFPILQSWIVIWGGGAQLRSYFNCLAICVLNLTGLSGLLPLKRALATQENDFALSAGPISN